MRFRAGALQPTGASKMFIRSADVFRPKRAGAILALALVAIAGLAIGTAGHGADGYPSKFSFGEAATEAEIASVAIAIPADGKGLPPGSGNYAKGKQVYETACAACHGADLMGVANLPDMPAGAALRLIGGGGPPTPHKPIPPPPNKLAPAPTRFDYIPRGPP